MEWDDVEGIVFEVVDDLVRRYGVYDLRWDLIGEGYLLYRRCLENYERGRGVKFSTYFYGCLRCYLEGLVLRELKGNDFVFMDEGFFAGYFSGFYGVEDLMEELGLREEEKEVLKLRLEGYDLGEIGEELELSFWEVFSLLKGIQEKGRRVFPNMERRNCIGGDLNIFVRNRDYIKEADIIVFLKEWGLLVDFRSCLRCGGGSLVLRNSVSKGFIYRCGRCKFEWSVRRGSVLEGIRLDFLEILEVLNYICEGKSAYYIAKKLRFSKVTSLKVRKKFEGFLMNFCGYECLRYKKIG
jgi:DNA-binding CsgD family transcriptional regulator